MCSWHSPAKGGPRKRPLRTIDSSSDKTECCVVRLQNVSKTEEYSRAQQSTPEHNELATRQRITKELRRKSRAIS